MVFKKKLYIAIALFCVTAALLIMGVWALSSASFEVGGTISFYADNVHAIVSGKIEGSVGGTIYPEDLKYSAEHEPDTDDLATWKNDLTFDKTGTNVVFTINVENLSAERDLFVSITDSVNVSSETITRSLQCGEEVYTLGKEVLVETLTTKTFTITFDITNLDKSTSIDYGYIIYLEDENHPTENTEVEGLSLEFDEQAMTVAISGDGTQKDVVIPAYISKGEKVYKVTEIAASAFENDTTIETISIPETIEKIGDKAFTGCTNLDYEVLNNGRYIGNSENPYLVLLAPDTNGFETFTINDSTQHIYYRALASQSNLKSIIIPDSVISMGQGALGMNPALKQVTLSKNLTYIPEKLLYNCGALESVEIPEGVKWIESLAFRGCAGLSEIFIPASIKSIGEGAFYYCTALEEISIPEGVKHIGPSVFRNCESLKEIVLPNSVVDCGQYTFAFCYDLVSVKLSNNITVIPNSMFGDCESLETVEMSDNVTIIGEYAFNYCGKVNFQLPKSLKEVHYCAFQYCRSMTNITLPSSLEFIADFAFNHYGIFDTTETIIIPAGIKQIGGLTYDAENPDHTVIGTHVFYDFCTTSLKNFYIDGANEHYMTVDGVLYREENGVPTVLIAYPADKRDSTYTMPDTVVNAFELSLSRPYYLREIVLSDSFEIEEMTGGTFLNSEWANNLSGMIYIYSGVTKVTCKDTNTRYMHTEDGQIYSKDGKILYYTPRFDGTVADSQNQITLTLLDGVTEIFHGALPFGKNVTTNVPADGTNVNTENHLKRYSGLIIPASVTQISDGTINLINTSTNWTIEVEEGNLNFEIVDGKLVRI